ncbi:MAG: endopeptidase La, partial [Clostridia bacterium]|nr:endopeptidase La [Clostridia bacterium]
MAIAKNHLVPKQLKRHGLDRRRLRITDEAIAAIIDDYTREAGVRNLEREIANVCRKTAKRVAMGIKGLTVVKNDNLEDLLGPRKMPRDKAEGPDRVGVVNGL